MKKFLIEIRASSMFVPIVGLSSFFGILRCPICDDVEMRFGKPEYINGNNHYEASQHVRGDVISIPFWGKCGHEGNLILGEDKEVTEFWFEYSTDDYQDYLRSSQWRAVAYQAKAKAGWKCQLCNKEGDSSSLHAHHRTYENIGNEQDGDIIVLCADCHAKFHNKN